MNYVCTKCGFKWIPPDDGCQRCQKREVEAKLAASQELVGRLRSRLRVKLEIEKSAEMESASFFAGWGAVDCKAIIDKWDKIISHTLEEDGFQEGT